MGGVSIARIKISGKGNICWGVLYIFVTEVTVVVLLGEMVFIFRKLIS